MRSRQHKTWLVMGAVLAVCLCLGCSGKTEPSAVGTAAEIKDGDTIVLTDGRKVRYLGMDTPELSSTDPRELELARQATQANAELVQGATLRLEYDVERYDQYNRVLAYVFLPDGRMLNAELIRRGLARVMLKPPNLRFREELVQTQRQAIQDRVGSVANFTGPRGRSLRGQYQELPLPSAQLSGGPSHRPGQPAVD
jgi:micrococcal nuclease